MRNITFPILLFLFLASFGGASAQSVLDDQQVADSLPLAIAVAIGSVATLLIFRNASKIGSGVLHRVYRYFAFGMALIVLGLAVKLSVAWNFMSFLEKSSDILFMVGFAIMGVGANKILESAGMK